MLYGFFYIFKKIWNAATNQKIFSMQISLTFFKVPFIFLKKFLMQQKIGKFFHKIWQLTFYQNSYVIWLKVCYSNSEHQFCIRSYLHLRKNLKHWKKIGMFFLKSIEIVLIHQTLNSTATALIQPYLLEGIFYIWEKT